MITTFVYCQALLLPPESSAFLVVNDQATWAEPAVLGQIIIYLPGFHAQTSYWLTPAKESATIDNVRREACARLDKKHNLDYHSLPNRYGCDWYDYAPIEVHLIQCEFSPTAGYRCSAFIVSRNGRIK